MRLRLQRKTYIVFLELVEVMDQVAHCQTQITAFQLGLGPTLEFCQTCIGILLQLLGWRFLAAACWLALALDETLESLEE